MLARLLTITLLVVAVVGCANEDPESAGSSSNDKEQELWQICQEAIAKRVLTPRNDTRGVTDVVWEHAEFIDQEAGDGVVHTADVADGYVHTDNKKFDFECGVIDGKFDWLDWDDAHGR
jgi:hypothetical protein